MPGRINAFPSRDQRQPCKASSNVAALALLSNLRSKLSLVRVFLGLIDAFDILDLKYRHCAVSLAFRIVLSVQHNFQIQLSHSAHFNPSYLEASLHSSRVKSLWIRVTEIYI